MLPPEELLMSGTADHRRRYRIILRGECRQMLADTLEEAVVESGPGWTCIMASVRDESELYGLLDRIQEFALHIVSLNELGSDVLRPRAALGSAW